MDKRRWKHSHGKQVFNEFVFGQKIIFDKSFIKSVTNTAIRSWGFQQKFLIPVDINSQFWRLKYAFCCKTFLELWKSSKLKDWRLIDCKRPKLTIITKIYKSVSYCKFSFGSKYWDLISYLSTILKFLFLPNMKKTFDNEKDFCSKVKLPPFWSQKVVSCKGPNPET